MLSSTAWSSIPTCPTSRSTTPLSTSTCPRSPRLTPCPKDVCDKLHIRKYGAHGTSYRYISKKVAEMTNGEARKVVVCHIGSGASLCAIEDGSAWTPPWASPRSMAS